MEHAVIDVDDLARCIEKLYLNPDLVRDYGQAGREFAETLAWDNLMPKWLEVISLVSVVLQTRVGAFHTCTNSTTARSRPWSFSK